MNEEAKTEQMIAWKPKAANPNQLLTIAISQGHSLDEISKLMDLQDRWQAKIAKSEYIAAHSKFKKELPKILRKTNVYFESKREGGTPVDYNYADLDEISEAIKGPLFDNGLTYDYEIDDISYANEILVTCILSHIGGHEKRVKMKGPFDATGNKSAIQAKGSTVSYLQRYTLIAILGLTTANTDNDGHGTPYNDEPHSKLTVATDADFKTILSGVTDGKINVESAKQYYLFTESQLNSLQIAEKNIRKDAVEF